MAADPVQITISFDALLEAISKLSLGDKQRLLDALEAQVRQEEEARWEQDPTVRAEMQASRGEYAAGDYTALDEYLRARRSDTSSSSSAS